jgi:phage shock protein PspC (stress-responsive transcriptional regulator)
MRRDEPRIRWPRRPLEGRLLAGVCAGIAEQYLVDVTLVRLAFLLLALAWGLGLLLYSLIWLLTLGAAA